MIKFELSAKQAVDHYIGGAIAWILNICAQLVAPILKRDHTLNRSPRTVMFLKFVGLGSIVRASFLLEAARRAYPDAKIVFATFPGCAPLVRMYPQVDEVLVVRDSSLLGLGVDTLKLLFMSWQRQVDLVVDLEVHSKYSSIIAALSFATDRAGFAGVTSRFRRGLYTHLVFWNPLRFVGHAYEQLGASLGWEPAPEPIPQLPENAEREVDSYLAKLGIAPGVRLIGINPNASELKVERRWPIERFAELIRSMPSDIGGVTLLLGSKSERGYVDELLRMVVEGRGDVINAAGALSFAGYLALLKRLSVLVTNDSGPLHLARAFSVPTVSLWGPTHPISYSPRGSKHISIYRPVYCSPCTHLADTPPCGGDNQCLKQIPAARVLRAMMQLLEIPFTEKGEVERSVSPEVVLGYWRRASVPPPAKSYRSSSRREVVGE